MIEKELAHNLLAQMIRVRIFEEVAAEQYSAGHIRGFLHLYIGEEAVAVGAVSQLGHEDAVFATYREHAHALVRGVPAKLIMAEMFGKVSGCSRGRGGSMHLFDRKLRFMGGNAIVAGSLPLAVGLALAEKMQNKNNVVACFFGEGAMAEGEFHEAINLAALWQLPVLFICENNLYAMGTSLQRSESQVDLTKKAESYLLRSSRVDGMDVLAVRKAVSLAMGEIRRNGAPYFLECETYRFRAHSMFDPELYRSREEVSEWKKRDPIESLVLRLKAEDLLTDDQVLAMKERATDEASEAVSFAKEAPLEDAKDLYRFVGAEVGS